jgi:hypothetical protein
MSNMAMMYDAEGRSHSAIVLSVTFCAMAEARICCELILGNGQKDAFPRCPRI